MGPQDQAGFLTLSILRAWKSIDSLTHSRPLNTYGAFIYGLQAMLKDLIIYACEKRRLPHGMVQGNARTRRSGCEHELLLRSDTRM